MESTLLPFVSVIIPVYNDSERLKICLEALEHQTYLKNRYEVVVVDNGSDEAENIKEVVALFSQALAACESFPGSYAARNKGISLAKGEIIAFTDADCIPASNWIEKGVENLLKTPNCGLVAGKIKVFFRNSSQVTPIELYDSITAFPQKELLENHRYGATANVFTFKSVIEQVGIFDFTLKSGGDIEWGQRVASFGYEQIYTDDTYVAHPARYSLKELYQRSIRLAGGIYDIYIKKNSSRLQQNKAFVRILAEDLIIPIIFLFQAMLDSRLNGLEQKIQVSLIMFLARYIRALEMMRLKLGGISSRY